MIIFVGKRAEGGFAAEVAANPNIREEIRFIDPRPHIQDLRQEILIAAREGNCRNIIYSVDEFYDDPMVLIQEIARIRDANHAEPILLAPTTHEHNQVLSAAVDYGFRRFINSSATMSQQKDELISCITGFYDNYTRPDIQRVKEVNQQKEVRLSSFQTIGVMGCCHRIGTTTQAIQIVKYLQFKGYKACYVEMNEIRYQNMTLSRRENPMISFVEKALLTFDYQRLDEDLGVLTIEGVDMYYRQDNLADILDKDYDFYVYDYGVYNDSDFNRASFLKDDIQICACGAGTVELDYTMHVVTNASYGKANLIFSFTAEQDFEDILGLMGDYEADNRSFFAGFTPNPFILTDIEMYDEMLGIEEKPPEPGSEPQKKRKGLFRRKKKEAKT